MRKSFKVTPTIKKKLNALADRVGVDLNWNRACGVQWDGIDIACKNQDASNIIHDIAHYAVASKKERRHPDFGLGPGPDTVGYFDALYKYGECSGIERKASALGIYWEKELGLNWISTRDYHNWDESELEEEWKSLTRMIRKYKESK